MPPLSSQWSRVPQRAVVGVMCYLMVTICYFQRETFYQAREMLSFTVSSDNRTLYSRCPFVTSNALKEGSQFLWDRQHHVWAYESLFIGCMTSMVPAGVVADVHGAKGVVGWGLTVTTSVALFLDYLVGLGYTYILLARFVQGVGVGMVLPGVTAMISHWVPAAERSTCVGLRESGVYTGRVLPHVISVLIPPLRRSWRAEAYLGGALGVVVCVAWYLLVFSDPCCSRGISNSERNFILSNTRGIKRGTTPRVAPWNGLLTIRFSSLVLFYFGHLWVHSLMHTTVVTYLTEVVHLPRTFALDLFWIASSSGVYTCVISGAFSDWLINHGVMSRTANRKLFGFLPYLMILPLMFTIMHARCDGPTVAALYTCIYFFAGTSYGSVDANIIDMSPQHAGTAFGIVHTFSFFSIFIGTDLYEALMEEKDANMFRTLWLVNSVVFLLCSLPHLLVGSAEIQPWNYRSLPVVQPALPEQPTSPL